MTEPASWEGLYRIRFDVSRQSVKGRYGVSDATGRTGAGWVIGFRRAGPYGVIPAPPTARALLGRLEHSRLGYTIERAVREAVASFKAIRVNSSEA